VARGEVPALFRFLCDSSWRRGREEVTIVVRGRLGMPGAIRWGSRQGELPGPGDLFPPQAPHVFPADGASGVPNLETKRAAQRASEEVTKRWPAAWDTFYRSLSELPLVRVWCGGSARLALPSGR